MFEGDYCESTFSTRVAAKGSIFQTEPLFISPRQLNGAVAPAVTPGHLSHITLREV